MNESLVKDFRYLKDVFGDRLLAYMLAHDNLDDVINLTFIPSLNQLVTIRVILQNIFEQYSHKTDQDKLSSFVGLSNSEPGNVANILHNSNVHNSVEFDFADIKEPAEKLLCQIAKDIFPQLVAPILYHRSDRYYRDMWGAPFHFISDRYRELLLILTRNTYCLRNLFPTMKNEDEYRKMIDEGSIKVKEVFTNEKIFFWSPYHAGTLKEYYMLPYAIISNATCPLTNNVNKDLSSFLQSVVNEFRSFIALITQNKLSIRFCIGLGNIKVDEKKSIGKGFIRPITGYDKLRISTLGVSNKNNLEHVTAFYEEEEIWPLKLLLSKPRHNDDPDEFWPDNMDKISSLAEKWVRHLQKTNMAFILAYSDHILSSPDYNKLGDASHRFSTFQRYLSIVKSPINTSTSVSWYSPQNMGFGREVGVNKSILSSTNRYLELLDSLNDDVVKSFEISMSRLQSAITHDDPVNAVIDGTIVWENLLGSKSTEKLRENLGIAIGSITNTDPEEIKRLYDTRCDIVHGNRKSKLTRDNVATIYGDSQIIIKIAMDIFKYIINDNELKSMTNSDTRVKRILKRASGE